VAPLVEAEPKVEPAEPKVEPAELVEAVFVVPSQAHLAPPNQAHRHLYHQPLLLRIMLQVSQCIV
jgi:hypothetical protein